MLLVGSICSMSVFWSNYVTQCSSMDFLYDYDCFHEFFTTTTNSTCFYWFFFARKQTRTIRILLNFRHFRYNEAQMKLPKLFLNDFSEESLFLFVYAFRQSNFIYSECGHFLFVKHTSVDLKELVWKWY